MQLVYNARPRFTHLFNLSPAHGSVKSKRRVGRGHGSGRGGTSGRGTKGQKSRSGTGKPKAGFEGGQTTILKRFPKRGFVNPTARTWAPVNLDRIQHWIDQGRLSSSSSLEQPITARELLDSKCIHGVNDGVKLLGNGADELKTPIHVVASRASQSAIKAVEKLGGTVLCRYYNRLGLRDLIKGNTERIIANPTRRQDIEWYTDWKNRGYLSPTAIAKWSQGDERLRLLSEELNRFRNEKFKRQ